uniref:Secreted protein n=1 Tax=Oryza brachyantha TaxID=4533 RepID=J3MFS8_ORYBR
MVVTVGLCCFFYVLQRCCDDRRRVVSTSGPVAGSGGGVDPKVLWSLPRVESSAMVGMTFVTHDLREKTTAAKPPTPTFMSMMFQYRLPSSLRFTFLYALTCLSHHQFPPRTTRRSARAPRRRPRATAPRRSASSGTAVARRSLGWRRPA